MGPESEHNQEIEAMKNEVLNLNARLYDSYASKPSVIGVDHRQGNDEFEHSDMVQSLLYLSDSVSDFSRTVPNRRAISQLMERLIADLESYFIQHHKSLVDDMRVVEPESEDDDLQECLEQSEILSEKANTLDYIKALNVLLRARFMVIRKHFSDEQAFSQVCLTFIATVIQECVLRELDVPAAYKDKTPVEMINKWQQLGDKIDSGQIDQKIEEFKRQAGIEEDDSISFEERERRNQELKQGWVNFLEEYKNPEEFTSELMDALP